MVEYDEIKLNLAAAKEKVDNLELSLNLSHVREEIDSLEKESSNPDFWNDSENSTKVLQKLKAAKDKVESFEKLIEGCEEIELSIEIAEEEGDASLAPELEKALSELEKRIEVINLETLLSGEYDKNNAIISLNAGAGGTEAQDWVEMLYRMYLRWAERRGFKTETVDYLAGNEAGIKNVSVMISGENAYGYLKAEKGVHRLVRISPFDASGRRHTSFASLDVLPELDDDVEVDINPEDLKVDTYRASGAGGQHINKTESAIRITHIPTGVVVSCQTERSQFKNRDTAMKMLKAKLIDIKEREHKEKISDLQGVQMDIAWGSQIRSYVFHPYSMVKDHRTNHETGNVGAVMDGDIDSFINEYLIMQAKEHAEV